MKVTKVFTFDCAHMLSGYKGPCANLHGHTYRLEVTVSSKNFNPIDYTSQMVMDFSILKKQIEENILRDYDHAIILSGKNVSLAAENKLRDWIISFNQKAVQLPSDCLSTAENIANSIKSDVWDLIGGYHPKAEITHLHEVTIKLWETPTSYVEV